MHEAMNPIHYSHATKSDIQTMISLRTEFMVEFLGPQTYEAVQQLEQQLENYLSHAIENKSYICWIATSENKTVGIGGMAMREQPGNFKNPSGKSGYIMNMYTVPAYRKKGICTTLLRRLMETGKEMGIILFELHATKEGEPVYQKSGFQIHGEPTYRKYGFDN